MKFPTLFLFLVFSTGLFSQQNAIPPKGMETDWGLSKISDTMLIDQTEILVQEWLEFIYYQDITEFVFYSFWGNSISESEKQKLINTTINPLFLPSKSILDQLPENYLFTKCKKCDFLKVDGTSTAIQLPFEADSLANKESKERIIANLKLPIVGISYEQAVEFCKWRTKTDSIKYHLYELKYYNQPDKKFGPVTIHNVDDWIRKRMAKAFCI
ncbi:MAG TPA: hypothetical protein VFF27_00575 [Bacteroidia bacterium]|jgi:formylglycine-generating enzyme required for sulfatase activity|nr:hypothetical protein [Bacteroidia bacterium]